MAKKKSAKKSVAPKKTAVKKQSAPKGKNKAKKAAPAKASAKKIAKKSTPKSSAKKAPVKKIAAKATAKKAVAKKGLSPKTAAKIPLKKSASAKPSMQKATPAKSSAPAAKSTKKLDLSHFVTPLDDRLIVQVVVGPRMTSGGLHIPDTVEAAGNREAIVVAVGRGHLGPKGRIHPMDVQVGDKILFPEHAGSKIQIQNEDLIILREAEVMGVVSK